MWLTPITLIAALAAPLGVYARSSTGDRVLVVADKSVDRKLYSSFFGDLKDRGFSLTYKSLSEKGTDLFKFDERQYDHLILFAPEGNKALPASLSPQSILSAQLRGLNTLYLLPPSTSDVMRDFMREYDLELSDKAQEVYSPFTSDPSLAGSMVSLDRITPFSTSGPVINFPSTAQSAGQGQGKGKGIAYPAGSAHTHGPASSPYLTPVLRAPVGSYLLPSSELAQNTEEAQVDKEIGGNEKDKGVGYGYDSLVSVFQTRDNARAGFVGSLGMVSDEYWNAANNSNAAFIRDFTSWVFQETGVVKVTSTRHHRTGEVGAREQYTKMDNLTYSMSVSTFNPTSATWEPFHLDTSAHPSWTFQLDFVMLDPYVRTALHEDKTQESGEESVYTVDFQAPDRHGVFRFMVDWYRPGYTFVSVSDTASVVPLRHDEYPRFVVGAYPYYVGTFSVSAAFLLFCGIWLALGEGAGVARGNKGKKAE